MTLVAHRRLYTHIMNQTPDGHGQTAGGAAKPDAASAGGGSDEGSSGKGAAVQRLQEAGLPSIILTAAHGGYAEWYVIQFWMKRVELVQSKAPTAASPPAARVCVVYSMYNLLIINLLMYALSTHVQTPAHMVCTQVDRVVAHRG